MPLFWPWLDPQRFTKTKRSSKQLLWINVSGSMLFVQLKAEKRKATVNYGDENVDSEKLFRIGALLKSAVTFTKALMCSSSKGFKLDLI